MQRDDYDLDAIAAALADPGFAVRMAPFIRDALQIDQSQWERFAASWEDLGPDRFMADGGRYRRRRFSALRVSGQKVEAKPRQPHFQSRDHNSLNGGVQRWFDAVRSETLENPVLAGLLRLFSPVFDSLDNRSEGADWHTEVHQFRIETSLAEKGLPSPEGMHRDGVDWVLVILVRRQNVEEGITKIGGANGEPFDSFVLQEPGDLVLLDDRKIMHGVTQILPQDPTKPAYRDVLVVTWRKGG